MKRLNRRRGIVVATVVVIAVAGMAGYVVYALRSTSGYWPAYGTALGSRTRTCTGSIIDGTPVTGAQCKSWDASGPVNVVISVTSRDPYQDLVNSKDNWRPAQGNWLVLQGYTSEASKGNGCADGWRSSTRQVELRLDPLTRRHFKFIYSDCTESDGTTVIFGEAHTDHYDLQKCGGDYVVDFNAARDALINSYRHISGVTVDLRRGDPANAYPDGCGGQVKSDGMVAHITLSG